MAELDSVSSMCTGSGSPPAASLAARWSARSSIQASPVSVEKNTSAPMETMRPSCSAARRWIERTSLARCKLSRDSRAVVDSCRVLRSVMGSLPAQAPCSRRSHHWRAQPSRRGQMELFTKLFGSLLVFVYHCFDRIVIHGYLSALTRPEQVVYFFRQVVGVAAVDKEVLSRRTGEYQDWVEAFARNHGTPIEWAEKGVRKEDYVQQWLRRQGLGDLRCAHHQKAPWQSQHHPRANRARASHLSCLLEARVCQAVREVRHLPAQRGLLEQSCGLRPEEGARTPGRRAREVPRHH